MQVHTMEANLSCKATCSVKQELVPWAQKDVSMLSTNLYINLDRPVAGESALAQHAIADELVEAMRANRVVGEDRGSACKA